MYPVHALETLDDFVNPVVSSSGLQRFFVPRPIRATAITEQPNPKRYTAVYIKYPLATPQRVHDPLGLATPG